MLNRDTIFAQRFGPGSSDTALRHPFACFPFSAGPRQCIGSHFALLEAQIILATVGQHFQMTLVPGHVVQPVAELNVRPRQGVNVVLHPQGAVQHE